MVSHYHYGSFWLIMAHFGSFRILVQPTINNGSYYQVMNQECFVNVKEAF